MGTLGYKVFEPLVSKVIEDTEEHEELLLFFKRNSGKSNELIEAKCKRTREGFVVLSGSKIERIDSKRIPLSVKEKRDKAKINSNNILEEDILLSSPSYAAIFVIGGHVNGLIA